MLEVLEKQRWKRSRDTSKIKVKLTSLGARADNLDPHLNQRLQVGNVGCHSFKAIHVPHKRVRYLGAVITIYAGTNHLAYDSKGILWAFGIEPKIIDGVWQSRGDSYEISRIISLPREDCESSLRAVDGLQES